MSLPAICQVCFNRCCSKIYLRWSRSRITFFLAESRSLALATLEATCSEVLSPQAAACTLQRPLAAVRQFRQDRPLSRYASICRLHPYIDTNLFAHRISLGLCLSVVVTWLIGVPGGQLSRRNPVSYSVTCHLNWSLKSLKQVEQIQ